MEISEISVWCKSRTLFFFGGKTREQPPNNCLLPEEVKHIAPTKRGEGVGWKGTGRVQCINLQCLFLGLMIFALLKPRIHIFNRYGQVHCLGYRPQALNICRHRICSWGASRHGQNVTYIKPWVQGKRMIFDIVTTQTDQGLLVPPNFSRKPHDTEPTSPEKKKKQVHAIFLKTHFPLKSGCYTF